MNPLRLLAPLAALLAALAAASLASGFDSTAWEFRQSLTIDQAGPLRVALPAETLDAARADLADLRLLGPDGAELPFALVRRNTVRPSSERVTVQPRLAEHSTVVEFALSEVKPLQRLRLETPATDFIKGATAEVQDERGRWQRVADSALIFRMRSGAEQLALELHGVRGRSVRLTIEDERSAPIPLTAVVVESGAGEAETLVDLPLAIVATEQEAGATRLTLDLGLQHRPIAQLVLEPRERVFQRAVRLATQQVEEDAIVEATIASGTLARLELPGERRFAQLALPVETASPTARLELVIDNGDSPPLTVERVVARLRRVDVGFEAPAAGTYTLLAGAPRATAPRYDVAAFASDWGRLPSAPAAADARTANPAYRPAQLPVDVPEFGGPLDASKWQYRRNIVLTAAGAQVLELDAEALALCRPDLADLRLARGERQVPYLLARNTRMRTAPLTLSPAPDTQRPSVGRWDLALPVAGMPITSLRLTVAEPVFARTAVVVERMEDSRGQPWPRVLGSLAIQRRSGDDPAVFTIPLQTRPQTGRITVELDHGDNAPFAPTKAEAVFPVSRLHFRATETAGCTLLYGKADSAAPRYDLQLAAPRLLAAPQHTATLEAGTAGAGPQLSVFDLGGPAARYLFWAALAVVVVVLVWLVARLLPKPPA